MSWSLEVDEGSGNAYYFNSATGAASWTKPTFTQKVDEATGEPLWVEDETGETTPYEPGWTIVQDSEGNEFWYNIFSEDTSWDPPPYAENPAQKGAPVKRRARAITIEHDDSDAEEEGEMAASGAPNGHANGFAHTEPQWSDGDDDDFTPMEELPDWQAYADGSLANVDLEGLRALYAPFILTPERLQSVPLLSRCTKADAEKIAGLFQAKHYPAGSQVLTKVSWCSAWLVWIRASLTVPPTVLRPPSRALLLSTAE